MSFLSGCLLPGKVDDVPNWHVYPDPNHHVKRYAAHHEHGRRRLLWRSDKLEIPQLRYAHSTFPRFLLGAARGPPAAPAPPVTRALVALGACLLAADARLAARRADASGSSEPITSLDEFARPDPPPPPTLSDATGCALPFKPFNKKIQKTRNKIRYCIKLPSQYFGITHN